LICVNQREILFIFKEKTMKKPVIFLLTASCLVALSLPSQAQDPINGSALTLTYVESSNGLANPTWEGGRTELEFADMNQDGYLDIISVGDHGNPLIQSGEQGIMVYFGDGQGNWSVGMTGELGYGGIAAGDVNNDGFMDVGYGIHHNYSGTDLGDQIFEVALGNGTGTSWTPWDDGLATNGEDWGMFSTDFADVDNDGDLDVGSISFGCCAGLHVYLNNMNGTWTQSWGVLENNSDMIFQFGDIDNDGNPDFVAAYQMGTAYFGDGEGGFIVNDQNLPAAGSLGRYGPSLGDVDGDGGLDLAFTNSNGGVFVYTFSEMLNAWVNFSGNLPATGPYEHTQLADMNMDGFIDLAAYGTGIFQLFLGDGTGNWATDATFTTGDPGSSQAFRVGGDFDHNGRPDMVLLEEEELSWFTYQNYLKCYKESSVPVLLSIQPVYPHGKELLRPGSVRFIDWVSTVPGSGRTSQVTSQVTLEYSTTGPAGPWTIIASNLPDNDRYQWMVPQENSADCYIRYTVSTGISGHSSITPEAFIITDGTIGIREDDGQDFEVQVWPNPAGSQLAIAPSLSPSPPAGGRDGVGAHGRWQISRIILTDLFGRKLSEFNNISSFPYLIDISGLNYGLYMLQMISEDGHSASAKFLKISD
jgi:hypothetical protein